MPHRAHQDNTHWYHSQHILFVFQYCTTNCVYRGKKKLTFTEVLQSALHMLLPLITQGDVGITPLLQMSERQSCSVVSNSLRTPWTVSPARLLCPRNSPGQNTRAGSCSLLQAIFPTQGSNPGLPCCRWILYCLSHQGSPLQMRTEVKYFTKSLTTIKWQKLDYNPSDYVSNLFSQKFFHFIKKNHKLIACLL